MSAPYSTVQLNYGSWDVELDASGNIPILAPTAESPVAPLEQDVASAALTFFQEVYYDTSLGVRWKQDILGNRPPLAVMNSEIVNAALTVPYVDAARLVITSFANRRPVGAILFTDESGNQGTVGL